MAAKSKSTADSSAAPGFEATARRGSANPKGEAIARSLEGNLWLSAKGGHGRAKQGNFGESHGGPANCEIRRAKSERRLPAPFNIQNSSSTFPHAPPRAASPS